MNDNKKSYYAIIPACVRYDKRLNANSKLLYGEITALCNEKGFCWASNNYFAQLYEVSNTSISLWVKRLKDCGYINVHLFYKEGTKEILNRYISLIKEGTQENLNTPIQENLKDNNTFNNNTFNKPNKRKSTKELSSSANESFITFWDIYNLRKDKKKCMDIWGKLNEDIHKVINKHIIEYVKSTPDKAYRKYPLTYLKNECWNDEIIYRTSNGKPKPFEWGEFPDE